MTKNTFGFTAEVCYFFHSSEKQNLRNSSHINTHIAWKHLETIDYHHSAFFWRDNYKSTSIWAVLVDNYRNKLDCQHNIFNNASYFDKHKFNQKKCSMRNSVQEILSKPSLSTCSTGVFLALWFHCVQKTFFLKIHWVSYFSEGDITPRGRRRTWPTMCGKNFPLVCLRWNCPTVLRIVGYWV